MRTKEERKNEVKTILVKLTELELTLAYELIKIMQKYTEEGGKIKINIPFPMINRRIKGVLMPNKNGDSNICLANEKFN